MNMSTTVEGLSLGLKILELFYISDRWTVTQVAERLGIHRSRAHRSLTTLVAEGYLLRAEGERGYVLGRSSLNQHQISAIEARSRLHLRPILQDIFEATGESVHSSVLVGTELLVIDGRRSKYQHDIGLRVGMMAPAHSMAGGKILLSYFTPPQIHALYPDSLLARRGPKTITNRAELIAELIQVKKQGYAVTIQESESEVNSVGMLLAGQSWHNRVAVVVSVPISRGSPVRLKEIQSSIQVILDRQR